MDTNAAFVALLERRSRGAGDVQQAAMQPQQGQLFSYHQPPPPPAMPHFQHAPYPMYQQYPFHYQYPYQPPTQPHLQSQPQHHYPYQYQPQHAQIYAHQQQQQAQQPQHQQQQQQQHLQQHQQQQQQQQQHRPNSNHRHQKQQHSAGGGASNSSSSHYGPGPGQAAASVVSTVSTAFAEIEKANPSSQQQQQQQQWYCEPCDKEFTQLNAYTAHIATHEKCHHPGCSFSGTRKVVSAHYHGSHGQFSGSGYTTIDVEGQKFRVLMGTSPDEVQQWRAERRKQFPTSATVEAKAKHSDELRAAGGIVVDKGQKRKRPEKRESTPGTNRGQIVNPAKGKPKSGGGAGGGGGGLRLPPPLTGGSQGSLLRKLLEEQVTVEENAVLQVFRFLTQSASI